MSTELNHLDLYRLPWTLPDNAISWLEPTSKCNLYCDGCYRKNEVDGHKPLAQIQHELEVFLKLRRTDSISIAGGDPLTHPDIERIVEMIAGNGQKPILNTNGQLLTMEKLKALKKAGVAGFTIHVDSGQHRPGISGKSEIELNDLRYHYASMIADVGDISCSFNATVYGHTLKYAPDIVEWGQKNIDIVQTIVFIAYRAAPVHKGYDYYVGAEKIDMGPIAYAIQDDKEITLMSTDIVRVLRERFPDFQPCAYLNGTERPDHLKWLLTIRLGMRGKIYGYAGSKFIEIAQTFNHLKTGNYLGYTRTKVSRRAKSLLLLSPFDKGLRKISGAYFGHALRAPQVLFKKLHMQSVMIIQPGDFMEWGGLSMCDGCPDITVHGDRLVWSCRLEELNNLGDWVRAVRSDGNGGPDSARPDI